MQHYVCGFDLVSTAAPVLSSGPWGNCMLLATMKQISEFILSFLTVIEYTRDQNVLYSDVTLTPDGAEFLISCH